MDELLQQLANYGPLGIVAGYLFWQTNKLQTKLMDIIEGNTKAMQQLKDIIDKCQIIHKEK